MKVLAAEVAGKQEQVAVLPDKTAELTANRSDLGVRQQGLKEKEAALVTLVAHAG